MITIVHVAFGSGALKKGRKAEGSVLMVHRYCSVECPFEIFPLGKSTRGKMSPENLALE